MIARAFWWLFERLLGDMHGKDTRGGEDTIAVVALSLSLAACGGGGGGGGGLSFAVAPPPPPAAAPAPSPPDCSVYLAGDSILRGENLSGALVRRPADVLRAAGFTVTDASVSGSTATLSIDAFENTHLTQRFVVIEWFTNDVALNWPVIPPLQRALEHVKASGRTPVLTGGYRYAGTGRTAGLGARAGPRHWRRLCRLGRDRRHHHERAGRPPKPSLLGRPRAAHRRCAARRRTGMQMTNHAGSQPRRSGMTMQASGLGLVFEELGSASPKIFHRFASDLKVLRSECSRHLVKSPHDGVALVVSGGHALGKGFEQRCERVDYVPLAPPPLA